MESETRSINSGQARQCQNCHNNFRIEPDDFGFYEKIGVPTPTWCPECRLVRRMMWGFNSRTIYQRKCDVPGHSETFFSIYAPETKNPVYDYEYWRSDAWDPLSYGREYDFSRPFFEQFKEFFDTIPLRNLEIMNSVRCEYCKSAIDSKDCYFSSSTFGSERCSYCHTALLSKDCVDATMCILDEYVYDSFSLDKSFSTTRGVYSAELLNCDFMYDCKNCADCLGCVGLRNKRFCIFNVQYSKDEYKSERAKYDLGSFKVAAGVKKRYEDLVLSFPKKFMIGRNAVDSTGDNLVNVKNCRHVIEAVDDVENCTYGFVVGRGTKDAYDISAAGLKSSILYECNNVISGQRVFFSNRINNSHDIFYSRDCFDSAFLFACVALRSKKYCIFNRQYSKQEYEEMMPRIFAHMKETPYADSRGRIFRFGEFFPTGHSPLFYNDSWASEYFPLTKEEAQKRGYQWHDEEKRGYTVTLAPENLPDHIRDVSDDILKEIIGCVHRGECLHNCPGAFRITPSELGFYRKMNIPIPRLCPYCRYSLNIAYRNPYKLWRRQCMCLSAGKSGSSYKNSTSHFHGNAPCPNAFETAYAPDRPDLIYCEQCYQQEIA